MPYSQNNGLHCDCLGSVVTKEKITLSARVSTEHSVFMSGRGRLATESWFRFLQSWAEAPSALRVLTFLPGCRLSISHALGPTLSL